MSGSFLGKALIVDDEIIDRRNLKKLLTKLNYETVEATNGQEAIDLFKLEQPSIVFMDIMMPKVDGYEATRQIKAAAGNRFIPVIFLTAFTDQDSLDQCVEAGGDDFLIKPFDSYHLQSKIQTMLRFSSLHEKLQGMYSRINREQEIAESVFTNAIQISNIENPNIQTCLQPASTFSGDMVLSAYAPSRDLYYLIGDFTGHGLSAALGALPVSEVFRAMVSKGFDGEDILTAINIKLNSLLPVGMFFGTQLIVVNHGLNHARIFNAGMPDILIVDGIDNNIKHRIKSRGLPLGIVESIDPKDFVQYVPITPKDRIFMYSDGLTEARNQNDHEFGEQRLEQAILGATDNNSFKQILSDLDAFCGKTALADDVTLVEITCVHGLFPHIGAEHHSQRKIELHGDKGDWSLSMIFIGARLRETNPVPILMNHIMEMEGAHTEREALFTIMTELYVNALDHGVLGLDSSLKSDPSGFARYFEARDKKLKALDSGYVKFDIAIKKSDRLRNITIQLEDSGDGFDHKNHSTSSYDELALSGRGIMLLEELCDSLQYFGNGNIARAVFSWDTE